MIDLTVTNNLEPQIIEEEEIVERSLSHSESTLIKPMSERMEE